MIIALLKGKRMLRYALTVTVLLVSFLAEAKTPGEIYEQAAKSTVVVRNMDSAGKAKSMGSGVVLPDRDVVTNCHVVKGASQLKVRVGKQEYPATLRYSDWDRDVCSLSVAGIIAPAVVVGSTKSLKVGAKVYAIGAPKGLELTLSDGIVSSLREVEGGQYIQTTAAISPGSSGGGLFDENGSLVGLTTFYFAEGQSLNFAVPVEWVKELPKRSVKAATDAQTMTQWLNKSAELESRKDWTGFLEHSLRWTKAQPGSDIAWFSLGHAYFRAKQIAKSIEAFQEALRINPKLAEAWGSLGVVYGRSGQLDKSIEAFQQALRLNPEMLEAWYGLGNAFIDTDQNVKAIEAYQQLLRISPEDAKAWYKLGVAYGGRQPTKAIEAMQQALRINPEYAEAWGGLGILYNALGQRDKVLEVYKRLKILDPENAEYFFKKFVVP
jgi:cytochrome c-type biogenesis protein CcmH/NrfG